MVDLICFYFRNLFKPHKDAFNFATGEGLLRAVENMHDERFLDVDGEKVTIRKIQFTKLSVFMFHHFLAVDLHIFFIRRLLFVLQRSL